MEQKKDIRQIQGGVTAVDGFLATGLSAGIKKSGSPDLALITSDVPCTVSALFTKNGFPAAPILIDKRHLKTGEGRAIIANSGNANAFTGKQGDRDAKTMAEETARELKIPPESVYVASTGVISELLPIQKIVSAIPSLVRTRSKEGGHAAAEAIMTTDTCTKEIAFEGRVGKNDVRVGGIAKGAGMIHPNLATMLVFLSTDVSMTKPLLQASLREAVNHSFHRITIDRDTSTNDMVLLFANGQKGNTIKTKGLDYRQFTSLLQTACLSLAKMLVKDGEGATKLIEVKVSGAKNDAAALKIAFSIANSLLVKTAFFGEDANWGRIIAAIGNSGVAVLPDEIDLYFGPVQLVRRGIYVGPDAEQETAAVLKKAEITLNLSLHSGTGEASVWTSDLSLDYVKINASYRT